MSLLSSYLSKKERAQESYHKNCVSVGDEESCNKCVAEYEKIVSIVTAYPQVKVKFPVSSLCDS